MTETTPKEGMMNDKRYFYTDPLAAAWMAKHFGMRFQVWNGRECCYREIEVLPLIDSDRHLQRFIHPESLPLLEVNSETDLTHHGLHRAVCDREAEGENRIFHRNGIPFIWPEAVESLSA